MGRISRRLERADGRLCLIVDWHSNGRQNFYSCTVQTGCGANLIIDEISKTNSTEVPTCLWCATAATTT